ncbi:MAG: hypothetical protein JWL60_1, partial [Gemmatimonadetes bacterium]|nr:hypothetical protein [Gemmatimonadota bacterium]
MWDYRNITTVAPRGNDQARARAFVVRCRAAAFFAVAFFFTLRAA